MTSGDYSTEETTKVDPSFEVLSLIDSIDGFRSQLGKFAKELRAARRGGDWDYVAVSRILESSRKANFRMDLTATLESTHATAERAASSAVLQMEADMRDLCARRAWKIDGQWPRLYVERAIDVEIDEARRTIVVGGSKLKHFALQELERAILDLTKELLPGDFSTETFMSHLARAYDLARGGASPEVPLLRVYRELVLLLQSPRFWHDARAKTFSELTASQFRARLSAALGSGQPAPDGRELRLLPPIEPKDSMFIYQPAERRFGFVGRIEFRSVAVNASR